MAIVTKAQLEQAQAQDTEIKTLPGSIPINKDRVCFRIIDANFGPSASSPNNMITLEVEIYSPETMKIVAAGLKEYSITGLKCKCYFSFSDAALPRLIGPLPGGKPGFMENLGLKPEIDTDNPDTEQFKGKCFSAIVGPDDRIPRKDITPDQRAAGQKVGDPITNEDGSVDKSYAIKITGGYSSTKVPYIEPQF